MQRNSRLFARLALRTNRAVWQDLPRCSNLLRNLFFGFLHAQRHPGQVSQNIPFLFSLFSHYKGLTPVVPNGKCIDFKGTELCILQIIYIIHPTSPPKKKTKSPTSLASRTCWRLSFQDLRSQRNSDGPTPGFLKKVEKLKRKTLGTRQLTNVPPSPSSRLRYDLRKVFSQQDGVSIGNPFDFGRQKWMPISL